MRRGRMVGIGVAVAVLAACSSERDAGPIRRATSPTTEPSTAATPASTTSATASGGASTTSTSTSTTTAATTAANAAISGTAVAGTAGGPEASGPPFPQTDPFAESVRLSDGTCVGWADSQGGSTAGLAVGAPVVVLDVEANEEIGSGTIQASRWTDMSGNGEQWNCLFDFTATITGAPAEFRIRVGTLEPWLARPDPSTPGAFVASVSTDASIGLIPSCPPLPEPPSTDAAATSIAATTTIATTTAPAQLVSGWNAVGQFWSRGVASLCGAGLPVTAIARPCRPPGVGSEYISSVVDSEDPTVTYANGASIPLGTALTVVVPIGRLCG